jgi:hypothetical protein
MLNVDELEQVLHIIRQLNYKKNLNVIGKKILLLYVFRNVNRYLSCQRRAELAQKIHLTELQIKVIKSVFFILIYLFFCLDLVSMPVRINNKIFFICVFVYISRSASHHNPNRQLTTNIPSLDVNRHSAAISTNETSPELTDTSANTEQQK